MSLIGLHSFFFFFFFFFFCASGGLCYMIGAFFFLGIFTYILYLADPVSVLPASSGS